MGRDRISRLRVDFRREAGRCEHLYAVGMSGITSVEARAVHRDAVFGRLSGDNGDTVFVNERALHAMQDFCPDVYDAWRRYEARLDQAAKAALARRDREIA
jgi:hypothetical protein